MIIIKTSQSRKFGSVALIKQVFFLLFSWPNYGFSFFPSAFMISILLLIYKMTLKGLSHMHEMH